MEKKFEMQEEGLIVTVENGDKLWLPNPEDPSGKHYIGNYTQTTRQVIDKDKANILRDFIASEKEKGDGQLAAIDKKLDELKGIKDDELDPEVVKAVKEQIGKGTKVFKQKMLVLNNHIEAVGQKQQLLKQREFMAKEVARLEKELSGIEAAIK